MSKFRKLEEVKQIQIGLTTRCNSHCRFCFREELLSKHGDKMHFYYKPADLPFYVYKNIFKDTNLTDIQMCGNKGDAIFHPDFERILNYTIDKGVFISLATNGSNFSEKWWKDLGSRMNGEVTFALDGLEDTHSMYRGTSFKKVYNNMLAYINGGGRARWQFIVFKHNEHQLEEAKRLSKEIGCSKFITVISRYYDDVMQKPSIAKSTKREMFFDFEKYPNVRNAIFGKIQCQWINMERIYISSRGYVYPCCYACCHMQNWHTHHSVLHFKSEMKQPEYNIETNKINEIIKLPWFTYIYENINKLFMCQLNCTNLNTYYSTIRKEEEL
jgi:MoaA/NifB/PqqE/SkfB family radical SAM enzyme